MNYEEQRELWYSISEMTELDDDEKVNLFRSMLRNAKLFNRLERM